MMSATMKIATDDSGLDRSSDEDNAPLGTAITSTLASEAAATSGYASPSAPAAASAAEVDSSNSNNNMSGSWQSVPSPSVVATPTASSQPQTSTFRIVTYAGTHIYCSAPTPADRDVWLASLHAGLESSMMSVAEVLNEVVSHEQDEGQERLEMMDGGVLDVNVTPRTSKRIREPNLSMPEQTILTPPLVQKRGIGSALRRKLLEAQQKGQPASELLSKQSDANISSFGYAAPFESLSPPANKHCISCGRYPPQTVSNCTAAYLLRRSDSLFQQGSLIMYIFALLFPVRPIDLSPVLLPSTEWRPESMSAPSA